MIPITRKELYLNKIVGNDDYSVPEKPISEEEFFFAEILGEAVQAPDPLTRYQMYLAKIAGREIEIPYPETRLEYFLARAAGMDVETPVPITREEIYWSNYTAIVEFEGVPPLIFKSDGSALKNYRIYGQTVDGESVGDRTGNLFDGTVKNGNYTTDFSAKNRVRGLSSTLINIGDTITVSNYSNINLDIAFCIVNENGKNQIDNDELLSFSNRLYDSDWKSNSFTYTSEYSGWLYLLFKGHTTTITKEDVTNIMLNVGSAPLPYEPYGYKVPVTVSNGTDTLTTPIYLPEQIKKVGDYIDYGEQKFHRISGADLDVILPALPTIKGTNVLSVGTEVQPSNVYIKYEGAR